jgi:hypothetical protein
MPLSLTSRQRWWTLGPASLFTCPSLPGDMGLSSTDSRRTHISVPRRSLPRLRGRLCPRSDAETPSRHAHGVTVCDDPVQGGSGCQPGEPSATPVTIPLWDRLSARRILSRENAPARVWLCLDFSNWRGGQLILFDKHPVSVENET